MLFALPGLAGALGIGGGLAAGAAGALGSFGGGALSGFLGKAPGRDAGFLESLGHGLGSSTQIDYKTPKFAIRVGGNPYRNIQEKLFMQLLNQNRPQPEKKRPITVTEGPRPTTRMPNFLTRDSLSPWLPPIGTEAFTSPTNLRF